MSDENNDIAPQGGTFADPDPAPAADAGAPDATAKGSDEADTHVKGTFADIEKPDAKTAPEKPVEQAAEPASYELTVDEAAFPMPAENLASFTAVCQKAGMTKEQAEAVLGWHQQQYTESQKVTRQEQQALVSEWDKSIINDPEFGGDNYKDTIANARKALHKFDPDDALGKLLRDTYGDHHPAVIKAVARVGKAMGEHAFIGGSGDAGAKRAPLEERMYPNMKF